MELNQPIQVNADITDKLRLFLRTHLADFKNDEWSGDVAIAINGSGVIVTLKHNDGSSYTAVVSTMDIVSAIIENVERERDTIEVN